MFLNSKVEWMELVMLISDKVRVEGARKGKMEAFPGHISHLYGIPAPQARCPYMELLLRENLSTRQNVAMRECYSSASDHICATTELCFS